MIKSGKIILNYLTNKWQGNTNWHVKTGHTLKKPDTWKATTIEHHQRNNAYIETQHY